MNARTLAVNALASALVLFLVSCTDAAGPMPNPVPPPAVARVAVSPDASSLLVGATTDLVATAHDADNNELRGLTVSWVTDRPDIATITAAGRVAAKAVGTATMTATIEGKSGVSAITVTSPVGPVMRVAIEPGTLSLEEGAQRQLVATAYDAAGQVVPGQAIEVWLSSDERTVSISPTGVVTAIRPGTVTIAAFMGAHTAAATVAVRADWSFDLVYDKSTSAGPELFALDLREPVGVPQNILAEGTAASDPTPSPDGSRIAFVVIEATSTAIYVANRDGTGAVRLTATIGFADQPAWSPDGSQLAFRYRRVRGDSTDIWVIDADGHNAVSLTADFGDASNERQPAWGTRIAFVRHSAGTQQIWSMRPDGIGKRRVTVSTTARDESPAWSPDGTKLAFVRDGTLWLVREAGGNERPLISLGGTQLAPAWSPDGKLIAFASSHEARFLIYTVWADGSRLALRTGMGSYLGNVAWRLR